MKFLTGGFICISIWLMANDGRLGVNLGSALECYSCTKCAKPVNLVSCTDDLNTRVGPDAVFKPKWFVDDKLKSKHVCVKQLTYVASKVPPKEGSTTKGWNEGKPVDKSKPAFISRFCAVMSAEEKGTHSSALLDVGGKFAVEAHVCNDKPKCNSADGIGASGKEILLGLFWILRTLYVKSGLA